MNAHTVRRPGAARSLRDNGPVSTDHYFSADPGVPVRHTDVEFSVAGRDYRLVAASGVFSAGRLDPGTAVLLKKATRPAGGTLLDLGCGYGPIACVLATEVPDATVYAIDVNARARELAARNAETLDVPVTVCAPEEVPPDVTFTEIWSNPPTHIGKAGLHALLERWLARLDPDGVAWLVINRHLGGDSLHAWLTGAGWAVTRVASQKGFRVLKVQRKIG